MNFRHLGLQEGLLQISIEDINTNIKSLRAGFNNGTVLESELSKLKVRKLELQSENLRLLGDIKAYFGDNTFSSPQEIYAFGAGSIAGAQLINANGDIYLDVVVIEELGDTIKLYLGDASGSFSNSSVIDLLPLMPS